MNAIEFIWWILKKCRNLDLRKDLSMKHFIEKRVKIVVTTNSVENRANKTSLALAPTSRSRFALGACLIKSLFN